MTTNGGGRRRCFASRCSSLHVSSGSPGDGKGASTGAGSGRGLRANERRKDRIWAGATIGGAVTFSLVVATECLRVYMFRIDDILSPSLSSTASGAFADLVSSILCSSNTVDSGAESRLRRFAPASPSGCARSCRRQNSCADSCFVFTSEVVLLKKSNSFNRRRT